MPRGHAREMRCKDERPARALCRPIAGSAGSAHRGCVVLNWVGS
eukprot:gene24528-50440_t